MTLEAELLSLIDDIGTDWQVTNANIGVINNLATAATNLVAAINEVKATADAAVAGTTPDATETTKGKVELATDAETLAFTTDGAVVTPGNLGSVRGVASGLASLDAGAKVPSAQIPTYASASPTVSGISELATNAEVLAFSDTARTITPSGLGSVRGATNGIASLDGTGKVPSAQLPTYTPPTATTTSTGDVELATDAEALALSSDSVVLTPGNLGAVRSVANGIASLDATGKVPSAQLPSYVDDTLEYANLAAFPATGETGKIYVTADTNRTYRWTGTVYVEISASPGSTDAVTEGSTNLYFTNARADARADVRIAALVGNTATDLSAAYAAAKA